MVNYFKFIINSPDINYIVFYWILFGLIALKSLIFFVSADNRREYCFDKNYPIFTQKGLKAFLIEFGYLIVEFVPFIIYNLIGIFLTNFDWGIAILLACYIWYVMWYIVMIITYNDNSSNYEVRYSCIGIYTTIYKFVYKLDIPLLELPSLKKQVLKIQKQYLNGQS